MHRGDSASHDGLGAVALRDRRCGSYRRKGVDQVLADLSQRVHDVQRCSESRRDGTGPACGVARAVATVDAHDQPVRAASHHADDG